MTDYALRCTQQDKPQLISLGVLQTDAETGAVSGAQGSAWDEIGPVFKDDAPVLADDGEPYWHANLRTDVDLATRASELGIDASNLARWFVVGPDGRPAMPATPARVWL